MARARGAIYQIKSLAASPPLLTMRLVGAQIEVTWDRGTLFQASDMNGPWTVVPNAFSSQLIAPGGPVTFYRVGY